MSTLVTIISVVNHISIRRTESYNGVIDIKWNYNAIISHYFKLLGINYLNVLVKN